jgi:hypothetical protein
MISMSFRILSVFVVVTAVAGQAACHRKSDTAIVAAPSPAVELQAPSKEDARLTEAVNAYAVEQNAENDAAVRKAMVDVDSGIAVLEELVAKRQGREREKVAAKLRRLEARRSEETTRFAAVQAKTSLAPEVLEGPTGNGKSETAPR